MSLFIEYMRRSDFIEHMRRSDVYRAYAKELIIILILLLFIIYLFNSGRPAERICDSLDLTSGQEPVAAEKRARRGREPPRCMDTDAARSALQMRPYKNSFPKKVRLENTDISLRLSS